MSANRESTRMRVKAASEVRKGGSKQTVSTSLPFSLEGLSNKEGSRIERGTFTPLVTCDLEKRGKTVKCLSKNVTKPCRQLEKSFSLPRLDLLPSIKGTRSRGHFYAHSGVGRGSKMTSPHGADELRLGLGHAPRRGRLQRGATWHDGLTTVAIRDQDIQNSSCADRNHIDWSLLKRHTKTSPRSKEHQIVFNELKILSPNLGSQDATNNSKGNTTIIQKDHRKSRTTVSKRWCASKTKLQAAAALKNIVNTTERSLQDSQMKKFNINETVTEGSEAEDYTNDVNTKDAEEKSPSNFTPKSRGWIIVKRNLSEIAAMAPKDSIDTMPVQFTNIVQIVRAKQFRLMMKRRASFIENGVFKFDEAKEDLYKRYDKIS